MSPTPEYLKVYAVWTNTDLTEGRGQEYIKFFCEKESTARRMAKSSYVMGTDAKVTEETLIRNIGPNKNVWYGPRPLIMRPSTADLAAEKVLEDERRRNEARERAAARARELGLTDEEIAALKG